MSAKFSFSSFEIKNSQNNINESNLLSFVDKNYAEKSNLNNFSVQSTAVGTPSQTSPNKSFDNSISVAKLRHKIFQIISNAECSRQLSLKNFRSRKLNNPKNILQKFSKSVVHFSPRQSILSQLSDVELSLVRINPVRIFGTINTGF